MSDTTPTLTTAQWTIIAAFGAILWFGAALLMRAIEPLGALDGMARMLTYALIVPGTVPFVFLLRRVAKLRVDQTAIAVALATGVAAMLDGTAFTWSPALYGPNPLGASATILWGAGVALMLGAAMNRPYRAR